MMRFSVASSAIGVSGGGVQLPRRVEFPVGQTRKSTLAGECDWVGFGRRIAPSLEQCVPLRHSTRQSVRRRACISTGS
jgi:hypothetical protein